MKDKVHVEVDRLASLKGDHLILNANNDVDSFSFSDDEIHAWIDSGELVNA